MYFQFEQAIETNNKDNRMSQKNRKFLYILDSVSVKNGIIDLKKILLILNLNETELFNIILCSPNKELTINVVGHHSKNDLNVHQIQCDINCFEQ